MVLFSHLYLQYVVGCLSVIYMCVYIYIYIYIYANVDRMYARVVRGSC